jgi:hypothetical protein
MPTPLLLASTPTAPCVSVSAVNGKAASNAQRAHRLRSSTRYWSAILASFLCAHSAFAQPLVVIEVDGTHQSGGDVDAIPHGIVAPVGGRANDSALRPAIRVGGGYRFAPWAVVVDVSIPTVMKALQRFDFAAAGGWSINGMGCGHADVTTSHRDLLVTGLLRREFQLPNAANVRPAIFGGVGTAFGRTSYVGACHFDPRYRPVNYPWSQEAPTSAEMFVGGAEELFKLSSHIAVGATVRYNLLLADRARQERAIGHRIFQFGVTSQFQF